MHENAELVRRGYEAFNTGDMETLTELFDESASWHTPGRARSPATTRAVTRPLPTSAGTEGETGGTFKAKLRHLTQTMTAA